MDQAAATVETHAPAKVDDLPQDTAAKLSRRILALESAHAEGTPATVAKFSAWLLAIPLVIVATVAGLFLWLKKKEQRK